MALYKTKPRTIQAIGVISIIKRALYAWDTLPKWVTTAYERGDLMISSVGITLRTTSALHQCATSGDYLVCDEQGRVRAVEAAQFEATYELIPEAAK